MTFVNDHDANATISGRVIDPGCSEREFYYSNGDGNHSSPLIFNLIMDFTIYLPPTSEPIASTLESNISFEARPPRAALMIVSTTVKSERFERSLACLTVCTISLH